MRIICNTNQSAGMDIQQSLLLEAKLKCSTIKDLFSQIMKNTKTSRNFYMNLHHEGIRMVFMEAGKQVEIYVTLGRDRFITYNLIAQDSAICKYDIRDLELIGLIFDNANCTLHLSFYDGCLKVLYENEFLGWTSYRIEAVAENEDVPEEVRALQLMGSEDEKHTKVEITKLKKLTMILHTFGLMRIENVELNLKSMNGQIQITALPQMMTSRPNEDAKIVLTLDVNFKKTQLLGHFRFNLKKFRSCMGLFDKSQPLEINFYQNCARFEALEKQKKNVTINLACLAEV